MIDINEIARTISSVKKNSTSLDLLLEFEGLLDNLNIYAYENWIKGEVIRGPIISKYWIEVYLMYPEAHMPNPDAATRLIKHGCYVFFQKDYIETAVKIKNPSDMVPDRRHPGRRKPDVKRLPVYVVKIVVPRHLLNDYNARKINVLDDDVNLDDIIDAYDQGLDVERADNNEE